MHYTTVVLYVSVEKTIYYSGYSPITTPKPYPPLYRGCLDCVILLLQRTFYQSVTLSGAGKSALADRLSWKCRITLVTRVFEECMISDFNY